MPGTLLADDWQKAVEDQLRNTAQSAQRQLQVIADVPRQAVAAVQSVAPPPPDPNQVFQSLQSTAQNALGGLQVLGGGVQQSAQDVNAQLQQTAQDTFGGLIPLQRPQPPIVTPPYAQPEPVQQPLISSPEVGRGGPLQDYARQKAQQYGVDPEIFVRQIQQESGFDPTAKSPAGAQGIAQIVPSAHPGVDTSDPYASLDYAARLMSNHLRAYNGDYSKALAAYNAGPGAVQQYGGVPPFEETQRYVRTIMGGGPSALEQANRPPFAGHAPSTPRQTTGTQIANAPNADGQVFPLAVRPSNKPDATYHSEGGSDLMAPRGTPVLNMRGGTVTDVYSDNGSHQAGGNAVLIHGDDGLDYYYAHFDQPPGLKAGQRVETGTQIGAVGNSGNAWKDGQGETHLHIGIGRGISNGVGSEGGLGRDFNAQKLLTDLLSGVGQTTTTAAAQAPGEPRRMGVIQLGDQTPPAARPPLYVGGQNVSELNERPGVQVLGDVFSGLGSAAQGAVQQIEPARRWLTGESQAEARAAGYSPDFQARARDIAAQPIQPPGPLDLAGSLIPGNPFYAPGRAPGLMTPVAPQDVAQKRVQINQAIEDSPVFQNWPVPVAAGIGVMATQILLDPATYVTAGPAMRAGQVIGQQVGAATGRRLLGRITASSVANGLQNAALELQKPNPDPLEVGTQFALGLGVGPAFDFMPAALLKVGRALVSRADELVGRLPPNLSEFLRDERGELDLDSLLGARAPDEVAAARPVEPAERPRVPEPTVPPQVEPPAGILPEQRAAPRTGLPSEEVAAGGSFRAPGETIKDATLRNLRETGLAQADEVGPRVLGTPQDSPEYLQGVVQFLGEQRQKILAGELTPRDVIKAYLNTMSSIRGRAGARDVIAGRAERAGFGLEPGAESRIGGRPMVRPEDAFASWLLSPEGRTSLDQLEQGDLTPARVGGPIDVLRGKAEQGGLGFGQPMLKPEMLTGTPGPGEFNLTNVGALTDALNAAGRRGDIDEALRLAGRMKGVGTAKEGFVAHLLGMGDAPTVDTNELKIWLGRRSPELQANVERAFGSKGSPAALEMRDQLMQRFMDLRAQGYGTDIPPEAFQHVMHHWLFDRALDAETTHAALYRAQQRAQAQLPFSLNLGGAALGGYAGYQATPENAPPEERLRNIGLGATAGLLGTRAATGRTAGRLAEAVAGRAEGFRAPERPTLEEQLARRGPPEGTELRATLQEPGGKLERNLSAQDERRLAISGHTADDFAVLESSGQGAWRESYLSNAGKAAGGVGDPDYVRYRLTPEEDRLLQQAEMQRGLGNNAEASQLESRVRESARDRLRSELAAPRASEPATAVPVGRGPRTLREPTGPRQPRTLGEVHSNPHLLREAGAGDTPLAEEDLMAHADQLEARLAEVRARAEAVDEQLRNPNQKPERPPWAAGYTNDQLIEIARKNGVSAFDEAWWDTAGLSSGSGEVREDIGQSGLRGTGQREPTPAELRVERNALAQEERDLTAAYDQLTTAPAGARFAARAARGTELPFDAGAQEAAPHGPFAVEHAGPSGSLAEDIVTRNGTQKRPSGLKGLWNEPGQVVGEKTGIKGRGIVDVEAADVGAPDRVTQQLMPNLDALLGEEMPEVRAQIQKAVEDNPELFAAYQQGRISHASLKDDLARRVGMSTKDWLKTPVGKGFTTPELVALQAAAVDAQTSATQMAREIMDRGGVDQLTPEEVAFGLSNLVDTTRLLSVARGARSTQGRSLNALKIRMDTTLARGITASNERIAARRTADQARRAAVKATGLLDKTRDLEQEAKQAVNKAREANVPRNIVDQIAEAYDQLDRYQAMSLHEKADDFAKLAKERADRAAARKEKVREAPEELLSALKAELAAERKIFAGRKNTWETMAFWDTKAPEIAAEKRQGFRAGLYLEQQRKAANAAVKANEEVARRAWEAESRRQTQQTDKASRLLEAIGGEKPSRELLKAFTEAIASDDPMVAAKFLKGLSRPQTGFGKVVEFARNANVLRLAGMLSATATHLVNAGGNVIQVPLELGTHAGTVGIDILRSAMTGGERQAYAAELLPMIKSYGPGFLAALPNALRVLKTGITPAEVADLSKLRPGFRSGLPGRVGEVVDPMIEMPLRALQASDQLFRGGAFSMHAQRVAIRRATQEGFRGAQRTGRANNIVANLEDYPELYKEAFDAAARMVYQERRSVPGLGGIKPKGTAADVGELAVSQVVAFRTTPANIFAQGFGLSPVGLLGVAEAAGRRGEIAARVATGELPAERLGQQTLLGEQRLARAAIGTGILGAGLWLGSQKDDQGRSKGMLTAMYDENEASTYPQGWRAWSMRVENSQNGEMVYVPLQNFGAAGVPLAMAALLTDAERRGKKVWEGDELMRAITGLGRYALDNTFLQGVSDWVDLLHDPARSGGKFVEGLVASYGPYSGMGRQVQRAQGVASRNPREGWLGLLDALEANYPGVSGNVPEATTPLGEPRTPGATGFGALVGRYDIERDNPTLVALRAAGVKVPAETKTLAVGRGYGVELSESERDQLKRARGDAIEAAVERERAKPRVAEWERTLQTAPPDSAAYKDALQRYNGALQATVSGAASAANIAFQKQLGRDQVQARMKLTREVEPSYIGPPAAPVGELAG